jgi:hypothetical protein
MMEGDKDKKEEIILLVISDGSYASRTTTGRTFYRPS